MQRIAELNNGQDNTLEVSSEHLNKSLKLTATSGLTISDDISVLSSATVYIVTVPTPTNKYNQPVLIPLEKASETVGKVLKKGDTVIYESTVYLAWCLTPISSQGIPLKELIRVIRSIQ